MKRREKQKVQRIKLKDVIKTELPPAIMGRITPVLTIGTGLIIASVVLLFLPSLATTAPMFLVLGLVMAAYALWQKRDVIKRGYDEYLFKVIDYTYITPMNSLTEKFIFPSGLLLMRKPEDGNSEDGNLYHIATGGARKNLPPIDWTIRVYVPKGLKSAQYGEKRYFPVVYGYKIEGEDKEQSFRRY